MRVHALNGWWWIMWACDVNLIELEGVLHEIVITTVTMGFG
jgi:hypothetical protein